MESSASVDCPSLKVIGLRWATVEQLKSRYDRLDEGAFEFEAGRSVRY